MGQYNFIKEFKSIIIALIIGVCTILSIFIGVNGLISYKKLDGSGITVTGSANRDFTSDLIVWRGSFSTYGKTTQEAYDYIKRDSKIIKDYLLENGVLEDEIIFYSVNISKQYNYEYNENGAIIAQYLNGYNLSQSISVNSRDVDKIESISRDITELIEAGVEFISEEPEYYYTKLDELKLEMIELATQNAKDRVDKIAQNANGKVGKLKTANLGVFQITAQNSDSEEYSYGGTFNTSSKGKTAHVTVKLNYDIE